ncbi:transposase [bacterium CPR1]|nr:transposase [bacterium CPR1]
MDGMVIAVHPGDEVAIQLLEATGTVSVERQARAKAERQSVDPELCKLLDEVLNRAPHLRRRSLMDYVRRHYGREVSRREAAVYLEQRGLVERPPARHEKPVRRFEAPAPLDLVQIDVMYVARPEGGYLYACNVLDDHSRVLLASVALEEQTGKAVLEVLKQVVERWGRPNRVLTDRGTQFAHWRGRTAFQKFVEDELKAEHILARAKHPQTIGKVERFHLSLRMEGLDPAGYADVPALQQALDRYRGYYNYERPHQGLGGVFPADRFYGMSQPLEQVWKRLPEPSAANQGVFLTANFLGRRLVIAGPSPDQLRVLFDDELRQPVARPEAAGGESLA